MIAVDTNNFVQGSGDSITKVTVGQEIDLLKVIPDGNYPEKFWLIGTEDRNSYIIYDGVSVPDPSKNWDYIDGEFFEYQPPIGPTA